MMPKNIEIGLLKKRLRELRLKAFREGVTEEECLEADSIEVRLDALKAGKAKR